MRSCDVFTEIPLSQLLASEKKGLIDSRWVHRRKPGGSLRSRLVRRGFNEVIESRDDAYAATPTLSTRKLTLSHTPSNSFSMYVGDVITAFLHANVIQPTFAMPPVDYQSDSNETAVRRLQKAMYGLKSAPKSWYEHIMGRTSRNRSSANEIRLMSLQARGLFGIHHCLRRLSFHCRKQR